MPIAILVDLDSEDVIVDIKWIVFYILPASIPCFLTAIGLCFMCKTNCKCKIQFKCCCPENLEKRDNNQIYGEYGDYDVMQVCILTGRICQRVKFPDPKRFTFTQKIIFIFLFLNRQLTLTQNTPYTTTWKTTGTPGLWTTILN